MDNLAGRRVAGIDVGSNSFLLAVVERRDGADHLLHDESRIVTLGQGVDRARRLHPEAVTRALAVLHDFRATCERLGVESIRAVGTSALRDAVDRADFLARVAAETGIAIEVISGEREAELTYADVARTHGGEGELALLDVGGMSSEVVRGEHGRILSRCSIDLGSNRARERAALEEPLTPAAIERCRAVVAAAAVELEPISGRLVGTGGTVTSLAAARLGLAVYDAARVATVRFARREIEELAGRLAALPLAERRQTPGLQPERAETIVPGALVVAGLMAQLGAESLAVSPGGLRLAIAREALDA